MQKLIREIPLCNGLTFLFFDATRRYFGDYHQVRIKISCDVPLRAEYFPSAEEHEAAVKLLGDQVRYQKEVEQQGVPTDAVAQTVEQVIKYFADHSLGYFENDEFPCRFVRAELQKRRSKGNRFVLALHG